MGICFLATEKKGDGGGEDTERTVAGPEWPRDLDRKPVASILDGKQQFKR